MYIWVFLSFGSYFFMRLLCASYGSFVCIYRYKACLTVFFVTSYFDILFIIPLSYVCFPLISKYRTFPSVGPETISCSFHWLYICIMDSVLLCPNSLFDQAEWKWYACHLALSLSWSLSLAFSLSLLRSLSFSLSLSLSISLSLALYIYLSICLFVCLSLRPLSVYLCDSLCFSLSASLSHSLPPLPLNISLTSPVSLAFSLALSFSFIHMPTL